MMAGYSIMIDPLNSTGSLVRIAILWFFPVSFFALTAVQTEATAQRVNDTITGNQKDTCCPQKDMVDLLFKKKNPFLSKSARRIRVIALPFIAYDPATSVQLGAAGSFSLQMGKPEYTKISAGIISALYTLKQQFIVQFKSNIFFPDNKWLLQTDWRYYLFKLPAYALGTQNQCLIPEPPGYQPVIIDPSLGGKYTMGYHWLKFHTILLHKVANNIFLGAGYHFDYHFNIEDFKLQIKGDTLFNTPHYAYSVLHGFNPSRTISSGVSADFVFDSRDDMINPYKGFYVNVNYRYNFTLMGSSRNGSQLWTEFRTYISLSKRCPRHLLAFWYYGSFLVSGDIPFLDLMSITYDHMDDSGRGYIQGRFRGENFVYSEVEYRFPISPRTHILGGVVFTNISTASNRDMHIPLFGYFQPAAGVGLRIMLNKHDRTNIAIDFGIGNMSKGVYLQTQEIF
jgi:hypothetical protein